MQLKLQRTQRLGGAFGNKVLFCLDARADYAPAEQANIRKYKLGSEVIYMIDGAPSLPFSATSLAPAESLAH